VATVHLHNLYHKYRENVDFLTIYIKEAHASDEWKLGYKVQIPQHKNLGSRIEAANKFKKDMDYQITLLVDSMENDFNETYAPWPERAYIIYQGKFAYISDLEEDGSLNWEKGVENWLKQFYPSM